MAGFKLEEFGGIRPRASDLRLAIGEATSAYDVDLERGLLRPRARQTVWSDISDPSIPMTDDVSPQTLFRFHRTSDDTDFWIYFESDVDVAPGPVDSDDQRHYYTGDGVPKMFTATSVNDTTPPYPEAADTKYPNTWYYLGVPAPGAAPEIDEGAIVAPSEGSVGLITSVTAEYINAQINANHQQTDGIAAIGARAGQDGQQAGVGLTTIVAHEGAQTLNCMRPGTRMRVESITDADNVVVVAAGRTGPIEDMGVIAEGGPAFHWISYPRENLRWLTRTGSNYRRKSFFMLPERISLEIENHVLRVGDIVRVTGSAEQMAWSSTPNMEVTPSAPNWQTNYGLREARPDTADDIVFVGQTSFMIERDGQSIDPTVPATADYDVSARAYVYTYATSLGEESAPSPPSPVYTVRDGDPVSILTFEAPPTEHRDIDRIWVYRTNTGTEETAFQFVGEVLVADIATGFVDEVPDDELGEVLETEGWDVPRSDMHSIVAMPNGMMAGLSGNRVCFSVPGFPHAWPRDYEVPIDFEAVGHEVFGSSLYVTTKGKPYVVTGVHPAQVSARRVETLQACIDKRSIVTTGDRILYVSREGLISGGYDGFVNISALHYTKEQWTKVVGPDSAADRSIRAWYFNGKYILTTTYSVDGDFTNHYLIFDFRDDKTRLTEFSEPVVAAYADPETAELYYVVETGNQPDVIGTLPTNHRQLLRWDYEHPFADQATGFATGSWRSPQHLLQRPMVLSAVRVICRRVESAALTMAAHGQVLVTVRGRRYDEWSTNATPDEDEIVLVDQQAVIDGQPGVGGWAGEQRGKPFRVDEDLNVLVDALSFEFYMEGPVEVEKIQLAESMDDLLST